MIKMNSSRTVKSQAALISVASNIFLILLKSTAGVLTGSVAILSDAIQSGMDLLASVITFYSVKHADTPADEDHHYGHEKLEDLSAGIEAMLLLAGAVVIALDALRRLLREGTISQPGIGIIVVVAAIAVNAVVSTYLKKIGSQQESAALLADAANLHTDAIVSLGVLASLIVDKLTGWHWIDPMVGFVVAAVITITAVHILKDSGARLLDEALPPEELKAIANVIDAFIEQNAVGYHDLRARHVGNRHQVDFHMQFADGITLQEAHRLGHLLQDKIMENLPRTTVLIHLEPEERVRPSSIDQRFYRIETEVPSKCK
jgi:cation diffusion facilitator family transporter